MTGYFPLYSLTNNINTQIKIGNVGIVTPGDFQVYGRTKWALPDQYVIKSPDRTVRELHSDPPVNLRAKRSMWLHGYGIVVGTVHVRATVDYGKFHVPEATACTNLSQIKVLRVRRSLLGKYSFYIA